MQATVINETQNGNGYDGDIELVTKSGTWIIKLTSSYSNKVERWADYQQKLYQFAADVAKEFGVSQIVLK
jgi:hypothetical protein